MAHQGQDGSISRRLHHRQNIILREEGQERLGVIREDVGVGNDDLLQQGEVERK